MEGVRNIHSGNKALSARIYHILVSYNFSHEDSSRSVNIDFLQSVIDENPR